MTTTFLYHKIIYSNMHRIILIIFVEYFWKYVSSREAMQHKCKTKVTSILLSNLAEPLSCFVQFLSFCHKSHFSSLHFQSPMSDSLHGAHIRSLVPSFEFLSRIFTLCRRHGREYIMQSLIYRPSAPQPRGTEKRVYAKEQMVPISFVYSSILRFASNF